MNKDTKAIEFQPVQEKYVYNNYDKLVYFKNDAMDHLVTEDHGMISEQRHTGELRFPKAKDWDYESQVIVSGLCDREDLEGWADDELRLLIWCVTDGSLEGTPYWRWHFKKQRKIDALSELLTRMHIDFSNKPQKGGTVKIRVGVLPSKFTKFLGEEFYKLSARQANIVIDTWSSTDGTVVNDGLCQLQTSIKEHADLLQALAVTSGNKATLASKNGMHNLSIRKGIRATRCNKMFNRGMVPYTGEVFCVSVPNGTLLARRKGKVIVTQNTHKVGEYTEGGSVFYETGCSCLPQDYYMSRGNARWENAYNIVEIVDGQFNYNTSRNYKWSS